MRALTLGLVATATLLSGCATYGEGGYTSPGYAYDWNRPDPAYGGYYADRYYVDAPRYRERRLGYNDRIYAGQDGRYYCRRQDGTTGLIVGGLAGGALGAALTAGGSQTVGTLLGAAGGALAGQAIGRNLRCR
ncbi:hypothetical protein [Sphingomonas fuzhouensis]|uniref:hypothetical protein n=1 Tax=Sphingomonas fuzhouensis TaxID=3106033 RepID=UPI002AFE0457|nr:hypothetical protein [Sphingomonas sp. SGZ-02]